MWTCWKLEVLSGLMMHANQEEHHTTTCSLPLSAVRGCPGSMPTGSHGHAHAVRGVAAADNCCRTEARRDHCPLNRLLIQDLTTPGSSAVLLITVDAHGGTLKRVVIH